MNKQQPACEQRIYKVTRVQLPLSCPMKGMTLWNAHPRVYLPIEKTGSAKCDYCGAEFILTDFDTRLINVDKTDAKHGRKKQFGS